MEAKRVKHNDKFFAIEQESFFYEIAEEAVKEGAEKRKLMLYKWVVPLYVKSINDNFDGIESFDLCPVDVSTLSSHTGNWKWCRNFEYSEIGKTIFYTEDEAWQCYHKTIPEDQIKVYKELRRLRFLEEGKADLI